MGSIASKPKQPQIQAAPVIVQQQPVETTVSAPTITTPDATEVAKTRVENILRRSRGTMGNVLTSLRGVLSTGQSTPQRKNLLGE